MRQEGGVDGETLQKRNFSRTLTTQAFMLSTVVVKSTS